MEKWTERRLERLFQHYNRIYWRGRLSGCRTILATLHESMGDFHPKRRLIRIDADKHKSDRDLRGTLLHEMSHAAAPGGHSIPFFAELERLIRRGAPVTVDAAEAGSLRIFRDIVPKRFPLVRAKMDRVEKRRRRNILAIAREARAQFHTITDDMIVGYFEDEGVFELPWKKALVLVGMEYGLTDESGRPVNAWARRIVGRAQKAYCRARRDHFESQRLWKSSESKINQFE